MPVGARAKTEEEAIQPWRQRSQKQTLLDASRRLRERVEETERFVDNARDGQIRIAVRRCICDAENLIGLAERLLRTDWLGR